MIGRVSELSSATKDLYDKIAALVKRAAPQLLAEPGIGVLLAAKFIGEIAGIDRFTTDAQLARMAGCAPIPVSSGRSDRHRLDPGGNRRLNSAFYMLAIIRIRDDPRTAVYIARQRVSGKTQTRSDPQPQTPPRPPRRPPPPRPRQRPNHGLLDIEDSRICRRVGQPTRRRPASPSV
jgi:transposase